MIDRLMDAPQDVKELAATWPLAFMFNLALGEEAVVAGAYKGKLMELLARLYPDARIIGFEPQPWAWEEAVARLQPPFLFNNVELHCYAIGTKEGLQPMGEWGTDACSFVNVGEHARAHGEGMMHDADEALTKVIGHGPIGLMILNMEGYEFELLAWLLHTGWLNRTFRLAVQWHLDLNNTYGARDMNVLINRITKETDLKLVYDHRPQWTYWQLPRLP